MHRPCYSSWERAVICADAANLCTLCSQSLQGHQTPVDSVTFDHNEEVVAAGASSGSIKLFDLDQAKGAVSAAGQQGGGNGTVYDHPLCILGTEFPSVPSWLLGIATSLQCQPAPLLLALAYNAPKG